MTKQSLGSIILAVVLGFIFFQTDFLTFGDKKTKLSPNSTPPPEVLTQPQSDDPTATTKIDSIAVMEQASFENKINKNLILKTYKALSCYQKKNCKIETDPNDPRGYESAFSNEIVRQLKNIQMEYTETKKDGALIEQLARECFLFPDNPIKMSALELLSHFPPSDENLNTLLTGLKETASDQIYGSSLKELLRYENIEHKKQIDSFLNTTIQRGGHFASIEVTKNILPHINKQNLPFYEKTLKTLPQNSLQYKNLRANLREFKRMKNGG